MTTTPLSPAAQEVKNAVLALYSDENVHKFGWQLDAPTVAAALRAAADQLQFHNQLGLNAYGGYAQAQSQLLAIAAELEGQS